jgi:hypothetical protein
MKFFRFSFVQFPIYPDVQPGMRFLPRSHLIAALGLDLDSSTAQANSFTRLSINVNGPSGQLPNLDLVSVTVSNARSMMSEFQSSNEVKKVQRQREGKEKGPEVDFGRPYAFLAGESSPPPPPPPSSSSSSSCCFSSSVFFLFLILFFFFFLNLHVILLLDSVTRLAHF